MYGATSLLPYLRCGEACLHHHHLCRYASTCQTVGMNIGYFTSFTVFLALNDVDFCNAYLRSSPSEDGHLTLSTYLRAWGWAYAVITLLVAAFKREVNFPPSGAASTPPETGSWTDSHAHLQLAGNPREGAEVAQSETVAQGQPLAEAGSWLSTKAGAPKEERAHRH